MIRNCSAWFKTVILCKKKSFYSCFLPVSTFFSVWSAVGLAQNEFQKLSHALISQNKVKLNGIEPFNTMAT